MGGGVAIVVERHWRGPQANAAKSLEHERQKARWRDNPAHQVRAYRAIRAQPAGGRLMPRTMDGRRLQ